jgi:hypothetical protein
MDARAEALYAEVHSNRIAAIAMSVPIAALNPRLLQAEAALRKGGGLFGGLFGISADKYEDAGEKFSRAGKGFAASRRCTRTQLPLVLCGSVYFKRILYRGGCCQGVSEVRGMLCELANRWVIAVCSNLHFKTTCR